MNEKLGMAFLVSHDISAFHREKDSRFCRMISCVKTGVYKLYS